MNVSDAIAERYSCLAYTSDPVPDTTVQAILEAGIRKLMAKYRDMPMSLEDACLVVMSEQHEGARVLTLDSHFRIYRRLGRNVIPVLMPEDC